MRYARKSEPDFVPQPWARNPHLQTVFASLKFRLRGQNPMLEAARETILPVGDGNRLLGFYSRRENSLGLAVLIHGWEGSSGSTYMLSTGRFLFQQGYSVFRLNLRDHGESHHLSRGLFHGALTEETVRGVQGTAEFREGRPVFVIGFSLGGNFALRVALRHAETPVSGLKRVIAVSPSLDPHRTTVTIDNGPAVYRRYFFKKWKNSLRKKQALYPDIYDFGNLRKWKTCLGLTEELMKHYHEFPSYREYFKRYTLLGHALMPVTVPVTIIAAEDDPIIPIEDVRGLKSNGLIDFSIQQYGGHCGFLDPFPFGCWCERKISDILLQSNTQVK